MSSLISMILLLMSLNLFNSTVVAEAGEEEVKPSPKPGLVPHAERRVPVGEAPNCFVNQAAIEDIKKSRLDNEAIRKELAVKEADLNKREQALNEELKKLEQARDSITKIQDTKKAENDERIAKLMETFVTMSPKAAAKLLATLDDDLAVATLAQMDTPKLAKIMNLLEPARSAKLSELMAGVVRAKGSSHAAPRASGASATSRDVAATTKASPKGGDKNDGHNENRTGETRPNSQQQSSSGAEKAAKPGGS